MSPLEHQDEITFKEVVIQFNNYFIEVKKRWRIIVVLFLLIGVVLSFRAITTNERYVAELNFLVSEDEGGLGGGLGVILGDIGFGGGGEKNLEKILQIAHSRKIFGLVIFDSVVVEGKTKILANDLLNELVEHHDFIRKPRYKFWKKESVLKDFQFYRSDLEDFDRLERTAFIGMYTKLPKVFTSKTDEDTGIMELKITTHSEELSYNLCKKFFEQLSSFYIEKSIEKQKETYNLINKKVDSIRALIRQKEYIIAGYTDSYRNIWQQKAKVPVSAMQKEVQMMYIMLGEAIKNKEIADFALNNNTPFIQVIDEPIKPLMSLKPSLWEAIFKSFLVALILGITYIIISKWIRDLL